MNFKMIELINSDTAFKKNICNIPQDYIIYENLMRIVVDILQPLRNYYKKPIRIHSGYRSQLLNEEIGGAKNSQHQYGMAVDFTVDKEPITSVIKKIDEMGLPYDQLINEYGKWIHISLKEHNNRHEKINIR